MTGAVQTTGTSVRLPADLRRVLRIKAAENDQTLTSEIVRRLEKSVKDDEAAHECR